MCSIRSIVLYGLPKVWKEFVLNFVKKRLWSLAYFGEYVADKLIVQYLVVWM